MVTTTRDLLGRRNECAALDQLVASVRAGLSRALVLRGEAGVGQERAAGVSGASARPGCGIVRAAGVESEMELAFAGLQQLCAPFVDRLERLPGPQREALGTAFGLSDGDAPDRFLVGLAVLGLLSDAAEERPLVCVVDDAQWLDARVGGGARVRGAPPAGGVGRAGLRRARDRRRAALRRAAGARRRRAGGRRRAGAAGGRRWRVRSTSACAIASWPRRTATRSRCSSCRAAARPPSWRAASGSTARPRWPAAIEARYQERLEALPEATRLLLLVAAAEPVGDPLLLWRAAAALGIDAGAGGAGRRRGPGRARRAGALPPPAGAVGACTAAAAPEDRRRVHRALADATDAAADPDRRAWHRAQATAGLDEDVAAELERSAARARARGGVAAGAAFHERAAELTPDPARRARRALVAAQCKHQAGAADAALRLLAIAQAGPLDELDSARAQLLHAQIIVRHDARPRRAAAAARGGAGGWSRWTRRSRARRISTRSPRRSRPTAWCAAATRARSPPRSSPPSGSPPRARAICSSTGSRSSPPRATPRARRR